MEQKESKAKISKSVPLIRQLREERNWSQSKLADLLGVSTNTVREWENRVHHVMQCILLCKVLLCLPEELLENYYPRVRNVLDGSPELVYIRTRLKNGALPQSVDCIVIKTRIALLRHKLDITQEQLAEVLAVAPNTVQNWESGRTSAQQFIRFVDLCFIFDCKYEDLVEFIAPHELERIAKLHSSKGGH